MIRLAGTVTYRDGREQRVEVMQGEYAGYERYAMRNGLDPKPNGPTPMSMQRYLGYEAVHRAERLPLAEWPTYEDWELDVADVTLEEPPDGEAAVPPTLVERLAE